MDDPLIGLTIFDHALTAGTDVVGPSVTDTTRTQSQQLWKSGDDGSEECFPCLPGISEDQHNEMLSPSQESQMNVPSHPNANTDPELITFQSHTPEGEPESEGQRQLTNLPNNYWLMRLFESNLFTMSIGIGYLFNSKDQKVLSYLGGKLFVSPNCFFCIFLFLFHT